MSINIGTSAKCVNFKGIFYAVAKGWVYHTVNSLGTDWEKLYQVFDEKDARASNLRLVVTLSNQKGDYNLKVEGAGRDVWTTDGKIWHDSGAIKQCVCDMKTILGKGCQCGGF